MPEKQGNRSFKHLTDRFIGRRNDTSIKSELTVEDFNSLIVQLINDIQTCLQKNDNQFGLIIEGLEKMDAGSKIEASNTLDAPSINEVANRIQNMRKQVKLFNEYHNALVDEEAAINRIETKAYLRATFFRTLTTALIAGVILGTYWIADRQGIQLPLSGLGKAQQVIQIPSASGN